MSNPCQKFNLGFAHLRQIAMTLLSLVMVNDALEAPKVIAQGMTYQSAASQGTQGLASQEITSQAITSQAITSQEITSQAMASQAMANADGGGRVEVVLQNRTAADVAQALESLLASRSDVQLLVNSAKNQVVIEGEPKPVAEIQKLVLMLDGKQQRSTEAKFVPKTVEPLPIGSTATQIVKSNPTSEPGVSASAGIGETNRWVFLRTSEQAATERRLAELLQGKLSRNPTDTSVYMWGNGTKNRLSYRFDPQNESIAVSGESNLVAQLLTLLQNVEAEKSSEATRSTKLLAAKRATAIQLQRIKEQVSVGSPVAGLPIATSLIPAVKANTSDSPYKNSSIVRPASFLAPVPQQDTPNTDALPLQEEPTGKDDGVRGRGLPDFGGNIDVEMLPDLDVLILRGRDQDLQQLADIVRELEAISKDTQPEVEVYHLQHTSAGAMATLLQQVNPDLIRGRQGRVTITSIEKPNALLVIGWGDAVAATRDLIAKLDQPVDPMTEFKVFPLKNATATGVQTTLQQFLNNRAGLGTKARLIADARTNSIIVAAAPRDLLEIADLIQQLDVSEGMAKSRVEVVQPNHMLAADLAETLQLTINAIQQGDQRSGILELLTIDEQGAETIRSGALRDVTITAQPRNNSILISAPPHSIALIKSLIDQLDQPSSTAQMKIFRIVNSDAGSIVQVLRSLLPSETAAGQPFRLPNTGDASSLVPLRFSIDTRTNSVLAIGNPADLNVVEALVLRLDEEGGLERKSVVYHLKNAPARDIAAAINEFLLNQRQLNLASPGAVNPYQQLEQEVIIVPEPVGNRLILSATRRYFEEISQLIQKLDEAPPQVMIQVLIAEVTLNNADEFGIELGLQDSVLFDRSLLGDLLTTVNTTTTSTASGVVTVTEEIVQSATNEPGFNFNSTSPLGNSGSNKSLANSKAVGGQGLSNFSVGRVNSELGFGGLVLSASGRNVSALLRALQESRRLEILSRPQIRSLDNQPAYIQVGQRVPRIIGSTVNQNGQTNTVALENVGLIMGVTPRISPDGTVVMEVDAEKSQLGPENEGIPVSVSSDGTIIRSPRIDTTTAQTTVSAASGETIVLGGLITKSDQQIHRKVPWLGDLPVIKHLFRFDSNAGKRTELVIILTPHVIRSPIDSDRIREIELARMSWCAGDVYEVHGDVHAGGPFYDLDADTQVIYPDGNPLAPESTPLTPIK